MNQKIEIVYSVSPYSIQLYFIPRHIRSAPHSLRYDPPIPTTTRLYHPEIRHRRHSRVYISSDLQTRPHEISRTHRQSNEKSHLGNYKSPHWRNRGDNHVLRTKRILRIMSHELPKNTGIRSNTQQRRQADVV